MPSGSDDASCAGTSHARDGGTGHAGRPDLRTKKIKRRRVDAGEAAVLRIPSEPLAVSPPVSGPDVRGLTLIAGSSVWGGCNPPHKTHREGETFDLRFGPDSFAWLEASQLAKDLKGIEVGPEFTDPVEIVAVFTPLLVNGSATSAMYLITVPYPVHCPGPRCLSGVGWPAARTAGRRAGHRWGGCESTR